VSCLQWTERLPQRARDVRRQADHSVAGNQRNRLPDRGRQSRFLLLRTQHTASASWGASRPCMTIAPSI
jgi:hypothetical protein